MPVGEQIALLYCGTNNLLLDIPLDKVQEFETLFLDVMRTRYKENVLDVLSAGVMNDEVTELIEQVAHDIASTLK